MDACTVYIQFDHEVERERNSDLRSSVPPRKGGRKPLVLTVAMQYDLPDESASTSQSQLLYSFITCMYVRRSKSDYKIAFGIELFDLRHQ